MAAIGVGDLVGVSVDTLVSVVRCVAVGSDGPVGVVSTVSAGDGVPVVPPGAGEDGASGATHPAATTSRQTSAGTSERIESSVGIVW